MRCRSSHHRWSLKGWTWSRAPKSQDLPAQGGEATQASKVTFTIRESAVTKAPEGSLLAQSHGQAAGRRKAGSRRPLHFKFYLDTVWYVRALPIVGLSALVGIFLMVVLSAARGKSGVQMVTQLLPWYIAFAPLQVLFFILAAMVVEERGGNKKERSNKYWCFSVTFGVLSAAAALDTVFGLGGFPLSYLGMAASAVMIISYVLYGCISKPGRLAKGKGTCSGGVDEESALLGAKAQARIPVRRPKQLYGPSRRLGKQSIKNYGTMARPEK
jgi:hypothetical protein